MLTIVKPSNSSVWAGSLAGLTVIQPEVNKGVGKFQNILGGDRVKA